MSTSGEYPKPFIDELKNDPYFMQFYEKWKIAQDKMTIKDMREHCESYNNEGRRIKESLSYEVGLAHNEIRTFPDIQRFGAAIECNLYAFDLASRPPNGWKFDINWIDDALDSYVSRTYYLYQTLGKY